MAEEQWYGWFQRLLRDLVSASALRVGYYRFQHPRTPPVENQVSGSQTVGNPIGPRPQEIPGHDERGAAYGGLFAPPATSAPVNYVARTLDHLFDNTLLSSPRSTQGSRREFHSAALERAVRELREESERSDELTRQYVGRETQSILTRYLDAFIPSLPPINYPILPQRPSLADLDRGMVALLRLEMPVDVNWLAGMLSSEKGSKLSIDYLAQGTEPLKNVPHVSSVGFPVRFSTFPLQEQYGVIEKEFSFKGTAGEGASLMLVALKDTLSFDEYCERFMNNQHATRKVFEGARKSGYLENERLARFAVPWHQLYVDVDDSFLAKNPVRVEVDAGRVRTSGTIRGIDRNRHGKYIIELDEPVTREKESFTFIAAPKQITHPIRSATEEYVHLVVKGDPTKGCDLE